MRQMCCVSFNETAYTGKKLFISDTETLLIVVGFNLDPLKDNRRTLTLYSHY